MSRRTRRLSVLTALAGLVAVLFTLLGGSGTAYAQTESPRESSSDDSSDVRVIPDPDAGVPPQATTAADLAALQACYAGAKQWDAGSDDTDGDRRYIPGWDDSPDASVGRVPVYVASERCLDVNLRITSDRTAPVSARVCFFPTNDGYWCNDWKEFVPGNTGWLVIASDVVNGTTFEVEFDAPGAYVEGEIAY